MRSSSTELLARSHQFETRTSFHDKNADLGRGWKDQSVKTEPQKNVELLFQIHCLIHQQKGNSHEMEMMTTEQDQEGFASQPLRSSIISGAARSPRKEFDRIQTLTTWAPKKFLE